MVFVGYMLQIRNIHLSYVEDGYISIWNIHFSDVVDVCIGVALIFFWWKHPGRNGRAGFGSGVDNVAQAPMLLRWPVLVLLAYALAWPFGMDHARHARSTLNLFQSTRSHFSVERRFPRPRAPAVGHGEKSAKISGSGIVHGPADTESVHAHGHRNATNLRLRHDRLRMACHSPRHWAHAAGFRFLHPLGTRTARHLDEYFRGSVRRRCAREALVPKP